jgi:hypothetical protein
MAAPDTAETGTGLVGRDTLSPSGKPVNRPLLPSPPLKNTKLISIAALTVLKFQR